MGRVKIEDVVEVEAEDKILNNEKPTNEKLKVVEINEDKIFSYLNKKTNVSFKFTWRQLRHMLPIEWYKILVKNKKLNNDEVEIKIN